MVVITRNPDGSFSKSEQLSKEEFSIELDSLKNQAANIEQSIQNLRQRTAELEVQKQAIQDQIEVLEEIQMEDSGK